MCMSRENPSIVGGVMHGSDIYSFRPVPPPQGQTLARGRCVASMVPKERLSDVSHHHQAGEVSSTHGCQETGVPLEVFQVHLNDVRIDRHECYLWRLSSS